MKHYHPEAKRGIVLAAAALCLLTVLTAPVLAQRSGGRPTPVDRRVAEEHNRRTQLEHDVMLGDIKATSEKPADQRQPRAAVNQVQQDFERIQTIYNEIVRGMKANSAFDYKFISDSAAEIKKRASRLKVNLALPRVDDDDQKRKKEQTSLNDEQMKPSLLILTSHIRSFVMNPLFESGGVLDIELSKRASRDLNKIIELSDHLRKSAGKLGETQK